MYSVVYNIGWVYVLWGHSEHSCYCCFITRLRVTLAIHSGWPLDWLAVLVVTVFLRIWTIGSLSFCMFQVMLQKNAVVKAVYIVVHSERRGSERDSVRSPWRVNMGDISERLSALCWSFPKTRSCGKCSVDISEKVRINRHFSSLLLKVLSSDSIQSLAVKTVTATLPG